MEHPLVVYREKRISEILDTKVESLSKVLYDHGLCSEVENTWVIHRLVIPKGWLAERRKTLPLLNRPREELSEEEAALQGEQWRALIAEKEELEHNLQGPPQYNFTEKTTFLRRFPIFVEVGGGDWDTVLTKLQEDVKNWTKLKKALGCFGSIKKYQDRQKFAKNFFESWDFYEAMPAWVKTMGRSRHIVAEVAKNQHWHRLEDLKHMPKNFHALLALEAKKRQMTVAKYLQSLYLTGYGLKDFIGTFKTRRRTRRALEVCVKRGLNADTLVDTVQTIQAMERDYIAAMRNGQKLLKAFDNERWEYLVHRKRQDMLRPIQVHWMQSEATKDVQKVASFQQTCPVKSEGPIFQLITLSDFKREGEEMDHCVVGSAYQVKYWVFSITTEEGRTTLGVYPNGQIYQHYGPGNTRCPEANKKIAAAICKEVKKWKRAQRKR